MLEVWLPLLSCMAVAATWYHVLRLRERAILHARRLCERHGLQLLDDSVALHRLRVNWRRGPWHAVREYRFDTSLGGHDRQTASITLVGDRIVGASLPRRDEFTDAPAPAIRVVHGMLPAQPEASGNVVPLTRARRTLH